MKRTLSEGEAIEAGKKLKDELDEVVIRWIAAHHDCKLESCRGVVEGALISTLYGGLSEMMSPEEAYRSIVDSAQEIYRADVGGVDGAFGVWRR